MIATPVMGRASPTLTLTDWAENRGTTEPVKTDTETLTTQTREWRVPTRRGLLVIQAETPVPSWFEPALEAMVHLLELDKGWDSYGAHEIDPRAILSALDLLAATMHEGDPRPLIVPAPRGGVQLEWYAPRAEIEIEILGNGRFSLYWERAPVEPDIEFMGDFNQVRVVLAQALDATGQHAQ